MASRTRHHFLLTLSPPRFTMAYRTRHLWSRLLQSLFFLLGLRWPPVLSPPRFTMAYRTRPPVINLCSCACSPSLPLPPLLGFLLLVPAVPAVSLRWRIGRGTCDQGYCSPSLPPHFLLLGLRWRIGRGTCDQVPVPASYSVPLFTASQSLFYFLLLGLQWRIGRGTCDQVPVPAVPLYRLTFSS